MPRYFLPSKRELTIVLFSITTFIFFYNFQSTKEFSFRRVKSLSQGSDTIFGFRFGKDKQLGEAGDRKLEVDIYGDWTWDEDKISGNEDEVNKWTANGGIPNWQDIDDNAALAAEKHKFGHIGLDDGYQYWGHDVPVTRVVNHIPGFTILENVIMLNGTVYFVTDDISSFPSLDSIALPTQVIKPLDWQVLSNEEARTTLGPFSGVIRGVTWLSTDSSPSNYTLFSFWRIHSSLDKSIDSSGATNLPTPRRLIFPNIRTYQGERPKKPKAPQRIRSSVSVHPFLLKSAFPTLNMMYHEDWQDFVLMEKPFMFERIIIADKGAAELAVNDVPAFAVPLTRLETSEFWWEPVRRTVAGFFGEGKDERASDGNRKVVITYISHQDSKDGPKLSGADHETLDKALRQFGRDNGYEVNVVSSEAPWAQRMAAIVRSTVILGVYGDTLVDSMYMQPSSHSTVMEIFPSDVFSRDEELAAQSIGIGYVAWQNERHFSSNSLPAVATPADVDTREITINTAAIIDSIRDEVERRS